MKERVGKKIKSLRTQRGLSQEETAEKLNISRSSYERMEAGKSNSWASHLKNLSSLFEVDPEYFVQGESNIQQHYKQNGGMSLVQNNGKIIHVESLSEELLNEFFKFIQEKQAKSNS